MIQKGQIDYAVRKAQETFDTWNDCTGLIPKFSGYYYEALGAIEEAAIIGIRVATGYKIRFDADGKLIDDQEKESTERKEMGEVVE